MLEDITQKTIAVNFTDDKLWLSDLDPADYGFTKDDDVVATVLDGVVMVGTREVIGRKILESIRQGLAEDGVTAEDLIAEGEKVREELYEEFYGKGVK